MENILNQEALDFFLVNFISGAPEEQRLLDFNDDLLRIKSREKDVYAEFSKKMHYFLCDNSCFAREFAIDPMTFKSVFFNRCFGYVNVAKEELLKNICLLERLSENEKRERLDKMVSGYVFFEILNFKTPILKIISGNPAKIKDNILLVMESKKVIFIDFVETQ